MKSGQSYKIVREAVSYRDILLAYSYGITTNWELSEEAVQDTFLYVYENWQNFREGTDIFRWLKSIARYRSLEVRKRLKTKKEIAIESDQLQNLIESSIDHIWDKDSKTSLGMEINALRQCMSKLPLNAQRMLWARYGKGHSYEYMASRRKRNTTYIANQLFQIRKKLKRCIADETLADRIIANENEESLAEVFNGNETAKQRKELVNFFSNAPEANTVFKQFLIENTALKIVSKQYMEHTQISRREDAKIQDSNSSFEAFDDSSKIGIQYANKELENSDSNSPNSTTNTMARFLVPLSLAACFTISIGVFWFASIYTNAKVKATVVSVDGGVNVIDSDGVLRSARSGDKIKIGQSIQSNAGKVSLVLADSKSQLKLASNGNLKWTNSDDDPLQPITLFSGEIVANIVTRTTNSPIHFKTPHARITILGTQFKLSVSQAYSKVIVFDGLVRFSPNEGAPPVHVSSGQYAKYGLDNGLTLGAAESDKQPNARGVNILKNPGFESSNKHWNKLLSPPENVAPHGSGAIISYSSEDIHSGKAALRISARKGEWISVDSDSIPVVPGASYRMSGWLRLEKGSVENPAIAIIRTALLDENGRKLLFSDADKIKNYSLNITWDTNGDYVNKSRVITIPENVQHVKLICSIPTNSEGTAFFDDLQFERE